MATESAIKAKQINVRLTAEQDRLLKQHCNRSSFSTQQAVIAALAAQIPGFDDPVKQ